jgi:hypothetical protein
MALPNVTSEDAPSLVEPEWGAYGALPRRSVPPVEVLGAAARPVSRCHPANSAAAPVQGGPRDTSGTGLCLRDHAGSRFPFLPGVRPSAPPVVAQWRGGGVEAFHSARRPRPAPVRWPARACRCRHRGRPGCTGLARGAHTTGPPPASRGSGPPRERSDRSRMACVSPRRLIYPAPSGMPTHCCRPSPIGAGGTEHPGS